MVTRLAGTVFARRIAQEANPPEAQQSLAIPSPELAPGGARDKRLYFLHVQKTAGTTVGSYLKGLVAPGEQLPAYFWDDLLRMPRPHWSDGKLVLGHFGRSYLAACEDSPALLVFLREPIARLRSHWAHINRMPHHPMHSSVYGAPLAETLRSEVGRNVFQDFQTRTLGVDLLPELQRLFAERQHQDSPPALVIHRDVMRALAAEDGEAVLEAAKALLDSCLFVGLQERLDESMPMLAECLATFPPGTMPYTNQMPASGVSTLSAEEADLVHELTQLDQRLYQHAKGLFARQLAEYSLERHRAWCDERLQREAVPLLSAMHVPLAQPFWGVNWWPIEIAADQLPFRWTGPGEWATIQLPIRLVTRALIRVRIIALAPPASPYQVRLACNGEDLPVVVRCVPGAFEVSAVCPATPEQGWTILKIFSPTRVWRDIHPETDDPGRRGLAVAGIEFVPDAAG